MDSEKKILFLAKFRRQKGAINALTKNPKGLLVHMESKR